MRHGYTQPDANLVFEDHGDIIILYYYIIISFRYYFIIIFVNIFIIIFAINAYKNDRVLQQLPLRRLPSSPNSNSNVN